MKRSILIFLLCAITFPLLGSKNNKPPIQQIPIGNFALPASQQPGPLIAFGQNVFDKHILQLYADIDYLHDTNNNLTAFTPGALYTFTDNFSLFIRLRSILDSSRRNNASSAFVENLVIQGEYAPLDHNTPNTIDMITIVSNFTIPISEPFPHVRFIAPGFFLGFTAEHVMPDWYIFISSGITIPITNRGNNGIQVLYQGGLSKNIRAVTDGWILNWMLELDGIYNQGTTFIESLDHIKGNVFFITPSIWFSTKRCILQGGISWVVVKPASERHTSPIYFSFNFGWTF